jgi:hypothetical protein
VHGRSTSSRRVFARVANGPYIFFVLSDFAGLTVDNLPPLSGPSGMATANYLIRLNLRTNILLLSNSLGMHSLAQDHSKVRQLGGHD